MKVSVISIEWVFSADKFITILQAPNLQKKIIMKAEGYKVFCKYICFEYNLPY